MDVSGWAWILGPSRYPLVVTHRLIAISIAMTVACAEGPGRQLDTGVDASSDVEAPRDGAHDSGDAMIADHGADSDAALPSCPGRSWQQPDPSGYCAQYEVPVTLPACDDDPSVAIVREPEDWDALNEPSKRVFCVTPGNYQVRGFMDVTASGTEGQPRVIRYYDPNSPKSDSHPVHQAEEARAVVAGFDFDNADWWVISGITLRATKDASQTLLILRDTRETAEDGGSHVVLDRLLVEGGGGGAGQILISEEGNVLQNSVVRNTHLEPNWDQHCVVVARSLGGVCKDVRIVNNEIYDCGGDSIQVHGGGGVRGLSVIENNDFYITEALYRDCDRADQCACAENALDLKNGGQSDAPLLIAHNRGWGFRPTLTRCSSTGSGGEAVVIHQDAQYLLMRGNVLFDSPGGIHTPNEASHHVSLIGNVIADMVNGAQGIGQLHKAIQFEAYYNSLVKAGGISGGSDHHKACNLTEAQSSDNAELCFHIRRWTDPQRVCIAKGRLMAASLSETCGQTGEPTGYGIDDRSWTPADAIIE